MTLGQRLKELRCEKDFSQHEIAKLARVAQPTYFAYETDKSTPHITQAEELHANAVVNVRFATSSITAGAAELYAYGTAVLAVPEDAQPES